MKKNMKKMKMKKEQDHSSVVQNYNTHQFQTLHPLIWVDHNLQSAAALLYLMIALGSMNDTAMRNHHHFLMSATGYVIVIWTLELAMLMIFMAVSVVLFVWIVVWNQLCVIVQCLIWRVASQMELVRN